MKKKYPILGSHVSTAGGLVKATQRARDVGCDCIQVFVTAPRKWPTAENGLLVSLSTKNNNQWKCKPLTDEAVEKWQEAMRACELVAPIAHASYLINLASPDDALWSKSVDALRVEWERADRLELDGLVVHPGAFTSSSEACGLEKIRGGILEILNQFAPQHCRLLLENTAGQGSCLGHQISHLAQILSEVDAEQHLGVCIDTCHAFAAGYEINTLKGFRQLKRELKNELPAGAVTALHLNDSKKECGSRVDRHEHIGKGMIGDQGFHYFMNDAMFKKIPGYLETPKGEDEETGTDLDVMNLNHLRSLVD